MHEIVCGFHDDYKTVFRDHDNNCLITLSARNVTNVEEVKAHCTLTSREWLGTLMKQVLKYNQLCYGSLKTGGRSSRSLACLLCGAECRRGVGASIVSAGGFAQVTAAWFCPPLASHHWAVHSHSESAPVVRLVRSFIYPAHHTCFFVIVVVVTDKTGKLEPTRSSRFGLACFAPNKEKHTRVVF